MHPSEMHPVDWLYLNLESLNVARTPQLWCDLLAVEIIDPDGWREEDDPPWEMPITLQDFMIRFGRSTAGTIRKPLEEKNVYIPVNIRFNIECSKDRTYYINRDALPNINDCTILTLRYKPNDPMEVHMPWTTIRRLTVREK